MHITDFSLDHFSLRGKRAIVTGGNTGLGQAFTLALAEAGADVFVPTLFDDGGETAALLARTAAGYREQRVDITEEGAPARVLDACVDALGGVDILVNSAGISRIADVTEFGRELWDPMVAVNLTAAFEMSHETAKLMIPQGSGKIINIASLFAFLGGLGSPAYAATKHGIAGLTKAYADELGSHGIQVNAIAPGYFNTPITEESRSDPAANQRIVDHTPAGRWGDVADLMGATVFLASRASDFVNGHVLSVDGGYLVR
ncbi:SDR family oxidoreductase [Microbacterium sp. KSW4-16]|uniref:SDR family oxidoreductase n=1 Tax=Microbacterium aurugineum TaxID=2851642 RepID=A0ABY4J3V5_9MICO|nr:MULTISPECIES: SDR family oxidoreductase [Microbacterium]MCK8466647.1 SDR family oxidoreductase [Microbacterium aurugineum]TCJ22214.1 SDR family oxidoreductase [Microbacterium sp. PI-1]UPL18308.1 SDR family oxidoreductase [Microbacterium aurugineum]